MVINLSKIGRYHIYAFLILLTFLLYGNSINNEYALDDNIVVDGNKLVEKGIKAIPEIFKSRYSVEEKQQYDYRPVVISSFAIEKQFFKKLKPYQTKEEKKRRDKLTQANISHFVNVVLYALSCVIVFQLLVFLFSDYNILLPFIIAVLYLIHPLHTEVVDNIKSRDEILMFLFMLLAIKFFFKYLSSSKIFHILIASFFVLLSVFSKKNGVAIVGVLPVLMYFKSVDYKKILVVLSSFLLVYLVFVLIKKGLLSTKAFRDLKYFENPLIFTGKIIDRITVGLYCSWFYLKMLVYPVNLSYYYGYNQIPMATFKNWEVWVSLLFYVSIGVFGIKALLKKKIIGLGIVLWLGVMLMVINVIFPIVGIVADRFTYVFSLGYCIVQGFLLLNIFKVDYKSQSAKIKVPKNFILVVSVVSIVYSGRTIARNPDWHDYLHLYKTDVKHLNESAKAHALIANTMYTQVLKDKSQSPSELRSNVNQIEHHFKESIRIDSSYATSLNNLGSLYLNFHKDYSKSIELCKRAILFDSNYVAAHYNLAVAYSSVGDFNKSQEHMFKIIDIKPDYLLVYDLLHKVAVSNNSHDEVVTQLKGFALKASNPKNIFLTIANILLNKGEESKLEALDFYIKAFELDNNNKDLCHYIVEMSNQLGQSKIANKHMQLCN